MQIITATWYDDFNNPFLIEHYESHINEEQLLDYYADQKSIYGKRIIADYADTRVFSDGTRVILRLSQVKSEIGGEEEYNPEETIDVSTIGQRLQSIAS